MRHRKAGKIDGKHDDMSTNPIFLFAMLSSDIKHASLNEKVKLSAAEKVFNHILHDFHNVSIEKG